MKYKNVKIKMGYRDIITVFLNVHNFQLSIAISNYKQTISL